MFNDNFKTQYTIKIDVYSFAIIFWQLYTGKMPYEEVNGSLLALEEKIVAGHRPAIEAEFPEFVQHLLHYSWDSNPIRRPTFQEIVDLIDSEILQRKAFDSL